MLPTRKAPERGNGRVPDGTLKFLLARALNENQRTILRELRGAGYPTKTSAARGISRERDIPESTVKWNYAVLEDAGVVSDGGLTRAGDWVHGPLGG